MRLSHLVPTALLALMPFAHAQYSPAYSACMHRAGSSTVQAGICAQAELSRQDTRLNHAYAHLLAPMPAGSPQRLELRDSERAWLAHRDQSCQRTPDTIDNACLIKNTADRADELERKAAPQPNR